MFELVGVFGSIPELAGMVWPATELRAGTTIFSLVVGSGIKDYPVVDTPSCHCHHFLLGIANRLESPPDGPLENAPVPLEGMNRPISAVGFGAVGAFLPPWILSIALSAAFAP